MGCCGIARRVSSDGGRERKGMGTWRRRSLNGGSGVAPGAVDVPVEDRVRARSDDGSGAGLPGDASGPGDHAARAGRAGSGGAGELRIEAGRVATAPRLDTGAEALGRDPADADEPVVAGPADALSADIGETPAGIGTAARGWRWTTVAEGRDTMIGMDVVAPAHRSAGLTLDQRPAIGPARVVYAARQRRLHLVSGRGPPRAG